MDNEKQIVEKLQNKITEELKNLKSEMRKGLIEKSDYDAKMNEINETLKGLKDSQVEKKSFDEIQEQVDKLQEKADAFKFQQEQKKGLFDAVIEKAVSGFEDLKTKGRFVADFETKSGAIDMGNTTAITGEIPQGDREPGISYAPKRRPIMLDLIARGTTNSNLIQWVEKTDEQGAPAFKKEFETYPMRSWKSVLRELTVKKIAVAAEYSQEILDDVDYFRTELQRDLVEQIQLKLDNEILNGTEGGASEAGLKGILQYAQAWSNVFDGVTKTVDNASIYDVIAVGITQVMEEHFNPTHVVMRPSTALDMKLQKDSQGRYLLPPFAAPNGVNIEGLPVITNTLFDANEILIMDATKATMFMKQNWSLEMTNSHSDNFTSGVLTTRLTGRGVLRVKNTDAKAFVHVSDYTTAVTALGTS